MRKIALAILALSAAIPVLAEIPTIKSGDVLVSSDGKRVGRIEGVIVRDGVPTAVNLIFESRFVRIPTSKISAGQEGRLETSLSRDEVRRLK